VNACKAPIVDRVVVVDVVVDFGGDGDVDVNMDAHLDAHLDAHIILVQRLIPSPCASL
jgi:hypothetical protein